MVLLAGIIGVCFSFAYIAFDTKHYWSCFGLMLLGVMASAAWWFTLQRGMNLG